MKRLTSVILLALAGCVTVPKETAILSAQNTARIGDARRANLALIDEWAKLRREKVEIYLHYRWAPEWIRDFMKRADFKKNVCDLKGELDQAVEMQEIVEVISKSLEDERRAQLKPVEEDRRKMRDAIEEHFDMTERINRAVTANLQSVVKGQDLEREVRAAVTKPLEHLVPLDKINTALDKALELGR